MRGLMQRKGKAGRAVFKYRGRHAMGGFIAKYASNDLARHRRLAGKGLPQPEPRCRDRIRRFQFAHHEFKIAGIGFDQIPKISLKLVMDALDKAGRAVKIYCFLAPNEQTKQMIESNEMIDMRMRD